MLPILSKMEESKLEGLVIAVGGSINLQDVASIADVVTGIASLSKMIEVEKMK